MSCHVIFEVSAELLSDNIVKSTIQIKRNRLEANKSCKMGTAGGIVASDTFYVFVFDFILVPPPCSSAQANSKHMLPLSPSCFPPRVRTGVRTHCAN